MPVIGIVGKRRGFSGSGVSASRERCGGESGIELNSDYPVLLTKSTAHKIHKFTVLSVRANLWVLLLSHRPQWGEVK